MDAMLKVTGNGGAEMRKLAVRPWRGGRQDST